MSSHCRTHLELPHLKDLQVLRSIHVKGSFQNSAEEVDEAHKPYTCSADGQVTLEKVQVQRRSATGTKCLFRHL